MQIHSEPTYESLADSVLERLFEMGVLTSKPESTPWESFLQLSDLVHERFYVPGTSFSPMMRRFLFALGRAAHPRLMVGIGTFVGYTFAWLLRDRNDAGSGPFVERAIGVDIDPQATWAAANNCALLGHGDRLQFITSDGVAFIRDIGRRSVDLLYIDVDDPQRGKLSYCDILLAALPALRSGSLVVAHDACEDKFHDDMEQYERMMRELDCFAEPVVLPIDACGVSIAAFRGVRR